MNNMSILNYKDVYVVETFEEAEQFRYEHNDKSVEINTAVGYDRPVVGMPGERVLKELKDNPVVQLVCFEGIYFQSDA